MKKMLMIILVLLFASTAHADYWEWTIEKNADVDNLILGPGESDFINYEIRVEGIYREDDSISGGYQSVTIIDSMAGNLGTAGVGSPSIFTYQYQVTGSTDPSSTDYDIVNTARIDETGASSTVSVHISKPSTPVPEPTTMLLLGLGLVGLAGIRRKL